MNKISKSLMALIMAGILFSVDAAMAATPISEALPTSSRSFGAGSATTGAVAPSGGSTTSQVSSSVDRPNLMPPPPASSVSNVEKATFVESAEVQRDAVSKKKKCPAHATCSGKKVSKFICNAGYYKKSAESTGCTKCPAGTYSQAESTKCLKCQDDTYSSAGASKCKTCPRKKKPNAAHTACVKI